MASRTLRDYPKFNELLQHINAIKKFLRMAIFIFCMFGEETTFYKALFRFA